MDPAVRGELLGLRAELARATGQAAVQQRALESEVATLRAELARAKARLAAQQQDIDALRARARPPEGRWAPGGGVSGGSAEEPVWVLWKADPPSGDYTAVDNESLEDSLVGLDEASSLEEEEEEAVSPDPPEEFFLYCVVTLHCQDSRRSNWAAAQLAGYIMVHVVLCSAFVDACVIRSFLAKWTGGHQYDRTCFFSGRIFDHDKGTAVDYIEEALIWGERTYWGVALPHIVVTAICLWLVALYFKRATVGLLAHASIAESVDHPPHFKALVFFGEVAHTVLVPCSLAAGTALQLSQSADVADVILNAFAVTFLMELDRTLYELALSANEKRTYEALWQSTASKQPPRRRAAFAANIIFGADLALLLIVSISSYRWSVGGHDQLWLRHVCERSVLFGSYFRAAVMRTILWREGGGRVSGVSCRCLATVVFQVFLTPIALFLLQSFFFRAWGSSDRVLDRRSVIACDSGNSSACHC